MRSLKIFFRTFTCAFIVMSGNVTQQDIQLALRQTEAMKTKLILLQDYQGNNFDMNKFKVPVLKYQDNFNYVKYLCDNYITKERVVPVELLHDFSPFKMCPVSLKARKYLPIIKG